VVVVVVVVVVVLVVVLLVVVVCGGGGGGVGCGVCVGLCFAAPCRLEPCAPIQIW